ncbi:uncharacterized protein LOC124998136 [Mugil cephalus]|uniref:uncharacterized protein LOC124998136 n=1 Tax=Mugil cephalus TaxID=48193 RepID=UPI001FB6864E|nr:uncharacterized protein LOC124998136 [Mugil cephalus]
MGSTQTQRTWLFCLAVAFSSVSSSAGEPQQTPKISLTSGGRVWSSGDDAVISKGYSFVFTCYINSSYTSGNFSLISGNTTYSEPTFINSATFNFPEANYTHQGSYRCVYNLTETPSISVTVNDPTFLLLLVSSVSVGSLLMILLLVWLVICLVRRRKAEQPGSVVLTQITDRYEEDDADDDDEADYVNVDQGDTHSKQTSCEDTDDDYINTGEMLATAMDEREEEEEEEEGDKGDASDDENDYVNVPKPLQEQTVDIYGGEQDIYQNL